MPNLVISFELEDVPDMATALTAWEEAYPIPEIDDPDNPGEEIPEYTGIRQQVSAMAAGEIMRKLNYALDKYNDKNKVVLSNDVVIL